MENIIIITSFSKKMYTISGKKCLKSIQKFYKDANVAVMLEDQLPDDIKKDFPNTSFEYHSIYDYDFFNNLKKDNIDIIPKVFGGSCNYSVLEKNQYYNYNSINWWKKVASIYVATKKYPSNTIIWLDSDCEFLKNVTSKFLYETCFKNSDMFYLKGIREAVESGLFGFIPNHNIINRFLNMYTSPYEFRRYKRFDDGFILAKAIELEPIKNAIDLNVNPSEERYPMKRFKKFIRHYKGTHRDRGIHIDNRRKR